jgi:hypothetical protein
LLFVNRPCSGLLFYKTYLLSFFTPKGVRWELWQNLLFWPLGFNLWADVGDFHAFFPVGCGFIKCTFDNGWSQQGEGVAAQGLEQQLFVQQFAEGVSVVPAAGGGFVNPKINQLFFEFPPLVCSLYVGNFNIEFFKQIPILKITIWVVLRQ